MTHDDGCNNDPNFVKVAHLRQVGFKFERWLDVVYMELLL